MRCGIKIGIFALLLGLTGLAQAKSDGTGFYVGAQLGLSNTHNKSTQLYTTDPNTGDKIPVPPNTLSSPSNTGGGFRFYVGDTFTPHFGAEIGYNYFSPSKYGSPPSPYDKQIPNGASVQEYAVDFDAVANYRFWDVFGVFGKAGIAVLRENLSSSLVNTGQSQNYTTIRPLIAVGVSYNLTDSLMLDLTDMEINGGGKVQKISFISFGISYHAVDPICGQFLC